MGVFSARMSVDHMYAVPVESIKGHWKPRGTGARDDFDLPCLLGEQPVLPTALPPLTH